MALLTAQPLSMATGAIPTYSAVNASDTITPDDGLFLHVKNTNGATRTVTLTVPGTDQFAQNRPDPVYTVAATTGELMIPLLRANEMADPTTGVITVTYSATPGVTAALVKR